MLPPSLTSTLKSMLSPYQSVINDTENDSQPRKGARIKQPSTSTSALASMFSVSSAPQPMNSSSSKPRTKALPRLR